VSLPRWTHCIPHNSQLRDLDLEAMFCIRWLSGGVPAVASDSNQTVGHNHLPWAVGHPPDTNVADYPYRRSNSSTL
jgi:hypothetical protein